MILLFIPLGTCSHRLPIFVFARGTDQSFALHMTKVPEGGLGKKGVFLFLIPH